MPHLWSSPYLHTIHLHYGVARDLWLYIGDKIAHTRNCIVGSAFPALLLFPLREIKAARFDFVEMT